MRRHVATLQFGRGSASLAREEYIILQAIAALRARDGGKVEVVGHADRGRAAGVAARRANRQIAERRAAAVAEALIALGLPRAAITAEGRGDTEPRYAETDAAGAAGNRRADIYLLSSKGPTPQPHHRATSIDDHPAAEDAVSVGLASEHGSAEASVAEPGEDVATAQAAFPAAQPAEATAEAGSGSRRVRVATLYFSHASSRLGSRERAIIEAAALFQRQHQGTLVITGHASAAGASSRSAESIEQANRSVSLARADAVAKALVAAGSAAEEMTVIGKGADEPAFAEADAAGEAGNRRVEIYVDLPAAVRLADLGQGLPR